MMKTRIIGYPITIRSDFPLVLLFLLFTKIACAQSDSTIVIKGVIDTIPQAQYYISFIKEGKRFEDTIQLDSHSRFEYKVISREPLLLYISIDNKPGTAWYDKRIVGTYTVYNFWADPGKITYVEGKKGSGNQVVHLSETEDEREHFFNLVNDLRERTEASKASNFSQAYDSLERAYMIQNLSNYFSLSLLAGMAKRDKQAYPYIETMLVKFPEKLRNTYLGKEIAQRLLINKVLAIGSVMPDFEQTDTLFKPVKLSDFRGKYVLVDFWASWCGPCRRDNPNLVKIYEKFSDKAFDILGISLDENKADWLQAIHLDGLLWTQVSDLKGFDNAVAKDFFIHAVPTKFLIDPNGVIIAKGFNSKQLEEQLDKIFSD